MFYGRSPSNFPDFYSRNLKAAEWSVRCTDCKRPVAKEQNDRDSDTMYFKDKVLYLSQVISYCENPLVAIFRRLFG